MASDDTENKSNEHQTLLKQDAGLNINMDKNKKFENKSQVSLSSSLSIVYICLFLLLIIELMVSFGLYLYILNVDSQLSVLSQQQSMMRAQSQESESYNRKKRSAVVEDNTVNPASSGVDANVEFFNPKLRQELEDKDLSKKKASGGTVTSGEGESANNPWVWLTSYSRIPLVAIQGFCSATRDYCPPGPPGSPGLPGSTGHRGSDGTKGDRGDRGFPGEEGKRGSPGVHGEQGPRGPEGESGRPGISGLDGRDGVPGEPGLDGIPGRNGLDGISGMDGSPGLNGLHGTPGTNGTDGFPGATGPQGPPGRKGPRGMPGPQGRPGISGTNGMPGIPGINAWTVTVNGTTSNELLIPPSIAGVPQFPQQPQIIIVRERENVRMRCAATGTPHPSVEWRKLDGSPIPLGSWQAVSISGHTLNFVNITRKHMGSYICIADNGVPPQVNKTFQLEVHFSPLIKNHNRVGVANGTIAMLECDVEAYPDAVPYWERADGRLLEHSDKYRMRYQKLGRYRSKMRLNITRIGGADYGYYHCLSKNELGITKGNFNVYEIDPSRYIPSTITQGVSIYGEEPPESVDLDDLCPPILTCPDCPQPKEFKCQDGGLSLFKLVKGMEIRAFDNDTYPGLPNRTLDCQLYAVGKPVYHRFTNATYGSWMRDSLPRTGASGDRFWVTKEDDSSHLYEYANKTYFRDDKSTRKYELNPAFKGNSHVVYNGSFYYNGRDQARILRFDLSTEGYHSLDVPQVAINGTANYLYSTEYNYMDFSVDDNGLWVIYGLPTLNNTIVMKVDAYTMQKQYMWNISVNHHKVGEMFVVCGVLYAVDNCTERNTKIRFALDLYKNQLLDVNLEFTNPFRRTTMIGYNHRNKELYTWDKGNQLTYPVRYHEIGYNTTKEEKVDPEANAQVQTGYDVYN